MAIAAVPRYLGDDYSTAAPGHRFGLYLKLWGVESRTRESLWTTHDINYRTAGQQREERSFKDENKTQALREALKLTSADKLSIKAIAYRQRVLALALADRGQLLRLEAKSIAPFSTGLGNEHPLENGFAFLNPYGLPYLAGSGVKGVLRQAARELARGDWGATQGWDERSITALFGREGADGDTGHQRGALRFWDVIPQLAGDTLKVEVMTPHQTHYYQNGATPHESGSPNPINFLAVPPESGFAFHVQCDRPFLQRLAPELVADNRWQTLIRSALEHAFEWLGFGAKTAVGYGAMMEDPAARKQRDKDAEAARRASQTPGQQFFEAHAQRLKAPYLQKPGSLTPQQETYRKLEAAVREAPAADKGWTADDRLLLAAELERLASGPTPLLDRNSPLAKSLKKLLAALQAPGP